MLLTYAEESLLRRLGYLKITKGLTADQESDLNYLLNKKDKEILSLKEGLSKKDKEIFEQCTDTIVRQVDDIRRMVDEFELQSQPGFAQSLANSSVGISLMV